MKALVQRVSGASVRVDGEEVSSIDRGFLVLLGVMNGDGMSDMGYIVRKVANLRVFHDSEGRMNLSLKDIRGEALVVSQFTLAADTRKGNRPSFTDAMPPQEAEAMYEDFMRGLRSEGISVKGGVFGADMEVSLVNDGPVTIMLDSAQRR